MVMIETEASVMTYSLSLVRMTTSSTPFISSVDMPIRFMACFICFGFTRPIPGIMTVSQSLLHVYIAFSNMHRSVEINVKGNGLAGAPQRYKYRLTSQSVTYL